MRTAQGRRKEIFIGQGVAWICMFLSAFAADAQAPPTLDVRIGFNEQFVPDQYTPIRVHISYQGLPLRGELILRQEFQRAGEPVRASELRRSLQLGPEARQLHELYLALSAHPAPGRDEPELIVSFRARGQEIATRRIPLFEAVRSDPLVLALSEISFPRVLPTGERVEQVEAAQLPSNWKGYAGVARLYLGRFHAQALSQTQQEALRQWLVRGGELIVLSGENFYVQQAPWLSELLPFQLEEIRSLEPWGTAIAIGKPLGEVLLYSEAGRPLLLRRAIGRGGVYFSALDLMGSGELERALWKELIRLRAHTESSWGELGPELFRQMELRYPPKLLLGALLALYVTGFGLLSLWVLRRPRPLAEPEEAPEGVARGGRVLLIILGWVALLSGVTLGYLQQPTLTSWVQSLEVGFIWGSDQSPWAWMQTWYSLIAKRGTSLQLGAQRDALVMALEETDLVLQEQPDQVRVAFSPLGARQQKHLYAEEIAALSIQLEVEGDPSHVRIPIARVYNQSHWLLRDAILFREGWYYPLGDLPPGRARELTLDQAGALRGPLMSERSRALRFEEKVKQRLYSQIEAELAQKEQGWVLLAWVEEERLRKLPSESRTTLKLLVIESEE